MEPIKEPPAKVVAEAVAIDVPVINDSSAGLARMYADLALPAARVRSAALLLLFISILFMGTLEGMFGLMASVGVLCCAAPGSLGTAYAARCTRIMATVAATLAMMHIFCLSTFAIAVLPEMPQAFEHACNRAHEAKLAIADSKTGPAASFFEGTLFDTDTLFAPPMGDAEATPKKTVAVAVAHVASTASRRLQELVPAAFDAEVAPCNRAQMVFAQAAPTLLWSAVFGEMVLFMAAMSLARAAGRLVLLARAYGANAI